MSAVCEVEPEQDSGAAGRRVVDMEEKEGDRIAGLDSRVARIQSDVAHIQSDVTDIKVESRRTNDKLDKLSADLASMKVWAMGLHVTLAGALLFVVAKGLKWI